MFYVAEALLLGVGLTFSKHSGVISPFGQRFAKTGRVPAEFHRYLIEGGDSRNVGDYDTGPGLSRGEAEEQIARRSICTGGKHDSAIMKQSRLEQLEAEMARGA